MERAKMAPSNYDGELIPSEMSEIKTIGEIIELNYLLNLGSGGFIYWPPYNILSREA